MNKALIHQNSAVNTIKTLGLVAGMMISGNESLATQKSHQDIQEPVVTNNINLNLESLQLNNQIYFLKVPISNSFGVANEFLTKVQGLQESARDFIDSFINQGEKLTVIADMTITWVDNGKKIGGRENIEVEITKKDNHLLFVYFLPNDSDVNIAFNLMIDQVKRDLAFGIAKVGLSQIVTGKDKEQSAVVLAREILRQLND